MTERAAEDLDERAGGRSTGLYVPFSLQITLGEDYLPTVSALPAVSRSA